MIGTVPRGLERGAIGSGHVVKASGLMGGA